MKSITIKYIATCNKVARPDVLPSMKLAPSQAIKFFTLSGQTTLIQCFRAEEHGDSLLIFI